MDWTTVVIVLCFLLTTAASLYAGYQHGYSDGVREGERLGLDDSE